MYITCDVYNSSYKLPALTNSCWGDRTGKRKRHSKQKRTASGVALRTHVWRLWPRVGSCWGAFLSTLLRIRAALAARIREYWLFNKTTGILYIYT